MFVHNVGYNNLCRYSPISPCGSQALLLSSLDGALAMASSRFPGGLPRQSDHFL
jgi:hypothetical protein